MKKSVISVLVTFVIFSHVSMITSCDNGTIPVETTPEETILTEEEGELNDLVDEFGLSMSVRLIDENGNTVPSGSSGLAHNKEYTITFEEGVTMTFIGLAEALQGIVDYLISIGKIDPSEAPEIVDWDGFYNIKIEIPQDLIDYSTQYLSNMSYTETNWAGFYISYKDAVGNYISGYSNPELQLRESQQIAHTRYDIDIDLSGFPSYITGTSFSIEISYPDPEGTNYSTIYTGVLPSVSIKRSNEADYSLLPLQNSNGIMHLDASFGGRFNTDNLVVSYY